MDQATKESSKWMKSKVTASTFGATAGGTRATGSITKCMVKDLISGQMVSSTLVNSKKTRVTEKANSSGMMEENTKEDGSVASRAD